MDQEKKLAVTEVRFGLTLLTCSLVAIGYVALLSLGGAKETSVEIGPDELSQPPLVGPINPGDNEPLPRVLPLEKPDEGRIPHTSKRPDSKRR